MLREECPEPAHGLLARTKRGAPEKLLGPPADTTQKHELARHCGKMQDTQQ